MGCFFFSVIFQSFIHLMNHSWAYAGPAPVLGARGTAVSQVNRDPLEELTVRCTGGSPYGHSKWINYIVGWRHACYSNRKRKKKHAGGRRIGNATSGGGQDEGGGLTGKGMDMRKTWKAKRAKRAMTGVRVVQAMGSVKSRGAWSTWIGRRGGFYFWSR